MTHTPQNTDHLADRLTALVSIATRTAIASVVEHAIEREYRTGYTATPNAYTASDTDAAKGARTLALAGIRMDTHGLFVEVNGSDRGLDAAADSILRVLVREALEARVCQCPESGGSEHEHRGPCSAHFEADVPAVDVGSVRRRCASSCRGADWTQ